MTLASLRARILIANRASTAWGHPRMIEYRDGMHYVARVVDELSEYELAALLPEAERIAYWAAREARP